MATVLTGDDAERFGNFSDTEFGIVFDDTAGFFGVKFVVDVFGGKVIFNDFVFDDAHSCFFDGGSAKNFVNLFLGIGCVNFLRGFDSLHHSVERFGRIDAE